MPKMSSVEEFEQSVIDRATHFTACRFLGTGKYHVRRADTLDAARQAATEIGGICMIYAVNPEGRYAHIENVHN